MKKLIIFLFVICSLSYCSLITRSTVEPDLTLGLPRRIGHDYLALQSSHFNYTQASRALPRGAPVGILDSTFGTDLTPIRYLLSHNTPSYLRVHIFNGSCVRGGNCGRYDPLYGLSVSQFERKIIAKDRKILKYLRDRVIVYRSLQTQFPQTQFLLSPVLEHNLSKKAWSILADVVLKEWSSVQLVNSPEGSWTAERYRNAWMERHGNTPYRDFDLVSLDGIDGTDINIDNFLQRTSSAKITFLWTRGYNCRHQGKWQDPRVRTSCPSPDTFNLMAHLPDDRGAAPTFMGTQCKSIEAFKAPMIWKPLAEDNGTGDSRANKPVTILGAGKTNLKIMEYTGKDFGTLGYYGIYESSLLRYYSSYPGGSKLGAFAIEQLARSHSGSSFVWLKGAQNKCFGPLIPGKRQGSYR